ncbi:MucR family transcriptional regulator [Gilliamella apicola]|uniref:MucR family transcriptional regulator n=1 Tax=Gilliamella apicola TaxID=1196095 RepID=UPI002FEE0EC7
MKNWSNDEVSILILNCHLPIREVMKLLPHRSYNAIYSKIRALDDNNVQPLLAKSFFNKKITSMTDVEEYIKYDLIQCLECGKWFPFLPVHLNRIHQIDSIDYRIRHNLPAQTPLAGVKYRDIHRIKMNKLISDGTITHEHLEDAIKKASKADRGQRATYELDRQREIIKNNKIWLKSPRTKKGHK